jgi:ribonuclease BN (tRNA processing enzyme)
MSDVSIRILGCGDAFGSGGRFHTCFHVTAPSMQFLIDCGASSLTAMARCGVDRPAIDAILISHLHGDHFAGVPLFLLDAAVVSKRTKPLVVAGPPGLEVRIRATLELLFPGALQAAPTFHLEFIELHERETADIGSLQVTPYGVVHPSGSSSYGLRVVCDGKVIGFSGDTEWTESLIDISRGADLFLCECYAFEPPARYHLDYRTLSYHRPRLETRRIVLTHMGGEMLSRAGEIDLDTAHDGQLIRI